MDHVCCEGVWTARCLWNEIWASNAVAAQRSPWAAAEQSHLQSDLNVFMACVFDKDEHSACFHGI